MTRRNKFRKKKIIKRRKKNKFRKTAIIKRQKKINFRKNKINCRDIIPAKPSYPFRSQLEKKIYKILHNYFPNEEIKINYKGLLKSNIRLELDLYFPKYKIAIEIQGPIHSKNETLILKDYEKKQLFLHENKIQLIYIYANSYKNQNYSLKKCINIINNERNRARE